LPSAPAAADLAPTSVRAPVAPGVAKARDRKVAAASTCGDCGVVESVRSFKRKGKGKGTGLGAVAGGVVGAAVSRQIGKGNGNSAMTVLGAVGGGLAGHEIEKRSRGITVHEVRVRMDDGSLLTLEQDEPPDAGDRVIVQGNSLRPA
jgi:outer membrane lipoprotein SlyB